MNNLGWNAGAVSGTVCSLAIVAAYAQGWIGWWWLLITPPLVILGAVLGTAVQRTRS